MIKGVDHIAVAVASLEDALPFYRDALGLAVIGIEDVPSQKVRVAILELGQTHLELLEPTSPDSSIARFLAHRGPGLHHVALATTKLADRLLELDEAGIALIDHQPQPGAKGNEIAFLHPKASGGVLLELCAPTTPPRT